MKSLPSASAVVPPSAPMNTVIGLVAAMRQESQALLRRLPDVKHSRLDIFPVDTFSISGQPYVLVTSGMGAKRAGQATSVLMDKYNPVLLISFGIAGAVEDDLRIGEVVLAQAVCLLESGTPADPTGLAMWPVSAREAMQQLLNHHGLQLFTGTAITTAGSQVAVERLKGFEHPVLEMETAEIARLAAQKGLPLLSLRAISDGPCAPLPLDLSAVMDENANLKLNGLLKTLIRNPLIIFKSGRVLKNTARAAESAAMALIVALKHWKD